MLCIQLLKPAAPMVLLQVTIRPSPKMVSAHRLLDVATMINAVLNMDGVEPRLSTANRVMPFTLLPENAATLRQTPRCL